MLTQKERVEIEELCDLAAPVASTTLPRWQRKALQARNVAPSAPSSTPSKSRAATPSKADADRFIPSRAGMDYERSHHALTAPKPSSPSKDSTAGHRVLALSTKAPAPAEGYTNSLKVLYSQNASSKTAARVTRHIPSAPERILDAPDLVDDYYLNLLDWSSNNTVAVALGQTVYLWNAATGSIEELMTTEAEDDYVCSVSWIKEGAGNYLAIGTNSATVQLWDAEKLKQVRSMRGHSARVGALDWNKHILSSGSRDTNIFNHDVRVREHHIGTFEAHEQEVCGLKWSPDGNFLASGSNDNSLCIWDSAATSTTSGPRHRLTQHTAAVKALAWCPWESATLASGGGTADRHIRFWNANTGAMLNSIDTGSQVCSLVWNPNEKEILSSHGFSQNQLCLWKYPSMVKVKELTGHTARVLHMAMSPDASSIVSAGADETLRFWRVFGEVSSKASSKGRPGGRSFLSRSIR